MSCSPFPGDDVVCAGPGADRVYGGTGDDRIFGGPGPDLLVGGRGDDRIFGGGAPSGVEGPGTGRGQDDTILGGAGEDTLSGGGGPDRITGGPGRDDAHRWERHATAVAPSERERTAERASVRAAEATVHSAPLWRAGVRVERGIFGARMEVALVNDGPVTIVLDT